jgi:hypothetical protein
MNQIPLLRSAVNVAARTCKCMFSLCQLISFPSENKPEREHDAPEWSKVLN